MSDPLSFPRLHPGISITPFSSGTREETFLLTCPDGRSLQISGKLRELLAFLDGKNTCAEIARHLSEAWQVPVLETEVRAWVARHLVPRDLLLPAESCREESAVSGTRRPRLPGVPLLSARNLLPFSNVFGGLFRPRLAVPLLWLSALCHFLLYTRLLSGGWPAPRLTPEICGIGTAVLFLSVLLHELGHLSACRYFLCPHGGIRFGLYLIFPVLYADVTPAWRLHRKARVVVDLGGVYFQLLLTLPLFCLYRETLNPLWLFLFMELDGLILFAMNPFLRFDGYWVCSDLLGVANLRSRSRRMSRALLQRVSGPRPSPPGSLSGTPASRGTGPPPLCSGKFRVLPGSLRFPASFPAGEADPPSAPDRAGVLCPGPRSHGPKPGRSPVCPGFPGLPSGPALCRRENVVPSSERSLCPGAPGLPEPPPPRADSPPWGRGLTRPARFCLHSPVPANDKGPSAALGSIRVAARRPAGLSRDPALLVHRNQTGLFLGACRNTPGKPAFPRGGFTDEKV